MDRKEPGMSRRALMRGAVAAGGLTILGAAARGAGKTLKVGLIGCGGRGNGAIRQHLEAAKVLNGKLDLGLDLRVVATCDWFKHKAAATGKRYGVPAERCFDGARGYQKLLETDVDIVLMATSPNFRPVHFEAAVRAGKHVFMEKPVAVDPPGCRRVVAAGELAEKKGLMVVAGTQRRHEKGYIDTAHAVLVEKQLGKLKAGRVAWCMQHIGWASRSPIQPKTPGDLVRTWPNWVELCGDHICEQHVHNLDIANWMAGRPPVAARGFGRSCWRAAGNMYDCFSIDFDYGDGVHIHSMCRQINGCWNWVGQDFVFERGRTSGSGSPRPKESPVPADLPQVRGGHNQEHVNLLYTLAKGQPLNEARNVAYATAAAVMGRISAYTGQEVSWQDMMASPKKRPELYNLTLKPTAEDFETGEVVFPKDGLFPTPGKAAGARRPRQRPKRRKK